MVTVQVLEARRLTLIRISNMNVYKECSFTQIILQVVLGAET